MIRVGIPGGGPRVPVDTRRSVDRCGQDRRYDDILWVRGVGEGVRLKVFIPSEKMNHNETKNKISLVTKKILKLNGYTVLFTFTRRNSFAYLL